MPELVYTVAQEISHAGALRFLFPLLAVVGPLISFYYGYKGVTQRKTLLLGRQPNQSLGPATTVEGTSAVILGIIYIASSILLAVIMLPIAGAILALL